MELLGDRRKRVKELLRRLHRGKDVEKVKDELRDILKELEPSEIAQIEEELIKEGVSPQVIREMCDVHLKLFEEALSKVKIEVEEWHPIFILMKEHEMILENAKAVKENPEKVNLLSDEEHYLREENVLFPFLEKHGVTQPPAIMWMEHENIKQLKKELLKEKSKEVANKLLEFLILHFTKENKILFPTALKLLSKEEWLEIRHQFDEIGYPIYKPAKVDLKEKEKVSTDVDKVTFDTGDFTKEELEAVLNSLPFDITFVDKEDTVRYFNQTKDRIFVRTKAVLGRKVQQCHPQKSIHLVNKILSEFKEGKREVAEFWINFKGRLIYIRYFPVRDRNGNYLGCIEVTQDITDVKKIEGEKRLLE